jgi:hypothetical protein
MPEQESTDDLLDTRAAAPLIGWTEATTVKNRSLGLGPPYLKIGKKVLYHRGDLLAWRDRQRREPLDGVLEALPADLRRAFHLALPRIRRERPAAIPALCAAAKYDREALETIAREAPNRDSTSPFAMRTPWLVVRIADCVVDADAERRRLISERDIAGTAGVVDPATWGLLERYLIESGERPPLVFESKRNQGFRVDDGTIVFSNVGRTLVPAPLFDKLLGNASFRAALADGTLIDVAARNGSNGNGVG